MSSKESDPFKEWYDYYPDNSPTKNPIPRPQPIDFVLSYFQNATNGTFVDVGAYDGVTWSNSLALEKYLSWTGICIEPILEAYSNLSKVRTSKCINSAISDFDGKTQFVKVSGYAEMLSGVVSSMNKVHLDRIDSEIELHGGSKTITELKVETLKSILERESISSIDYLSIDVECGELNVLRGIDWNSTKIKLISCEVNEYSDRTSIDSFLKDKNFKFISRVCSDNFYALQGE